MNHGEFNQLEFNQETIEIIEIIAKYETLQVTSDIDQTLSLSANIDQTLSLSSKMDIEVAP